MPLGQLFTVPECERDKVFGYKLSTQAICFKRSSVIDGKSAKKVTREPITTAHVTLVFPIGESPAIARGGGMIVLVIDGKLEGIGFNTLGVTNADFVLEQLKVKYGAPTAFVPTTVQTRLGASFDAFIASWTFPNLFVKFESVTHSINDGLVNIDTKKGKEWTDQRLKELLKDKRPL